MRALPQGRGPILSEDLFFVFRHQRLVGAVFLSTVLMTTVGVFLVTPTYETSTKILVKTDDRAKTAVSSTEASQEVISHTVSYEELLSQAAVLTSANFLTEVTKSLAQAPSSRPAEELDSALLALCKTALAGIRTGVWWLLSLPSRAYNGLHDIKDIRAPLQQQVAQIQGQLEVVASGGNLLEITYKDESAVRAARVANAITETYLDYYANVYMPNIAAERFFSVQSELLEKQLHASEVALSAFHQQHDVFNYSIQQSEVLKKLVDFEAQVKTVQTEARAERERVLALQKEITSRRAEVPSGAREEPDPMVTHLNTSLVNLSLQRDELLTRYTPSSGVVKEVDKRIEQTKKMLDAEEFKTKKATMTGLNPVYQALDTQYSLSRGNLAALLAKEAALLTHIENYRQQLVTLDTKELRLKQLEHEVAQNQGAYRNYTAKREESRIAAALDHSKILNLSIIETAPVPFEPSSPRKVLTILLGGVLGMITGLGVAFLRNRLDTTVKTPREIELYADLPVLAALPQRLLPGPVSSQGRPFSFIRDTSPSGT
jgi:uncharacterized protein involved in exopolysaccharide biosynthesis